MEQASCGACAHPSALHRASRGSCRLNGCPCTGFAAQPTLEAVVADGASIDLPAVSTEAFTAILTAIGFVIGLLIGLWL